MNDMPLKEIVGTNKKNERKKKEVEYGNRRTENRYRRLQMFSYKCIKIWKKSIIPHFGIVLPNLTVIYKFLLSLHTLLWFRC